MSVIIKSNNIATRILGTIKMLGTTPSDEFTKYKTRVMADGGIIQNESKTKLFFEVLFDSKMYGNMNTAVSSSFGVRLNSGGRVDKMYAIDGYDLVAKVYGVAPLPTIDSNGFFDFAENPTNASNGVVFTTNEKHIMSKNGRFGYLASVKTKGANAGAIENIAALALHGEENVSTSFAHMVSKTTEGKVDLVIHKDPLSLTVYDVLPAFDLVNAHAAQTVAFLTCPDKEKAYGFRDGQMVAERDGVTFKEIATKPFYLDFAGDLQTATIAKTYSGKIKDFFCFNHGTVDQIAELSAYK